MSGDARRRYAYVGCRTRDGRRVLVDLIAGIVEEYDPDTDAWVVLPAAFGGVDDCVFDDRNELVETGG